ncbi:MAG: type II secretion system major pseudopilin GspG [Gammaproteobacteria bacterium]|nr:type II secretion system major pseudopilin GspG [Gammaproteobacteria bacterium]
MTEKKQLTPKKEKGFTLLEILMVVVIIGILAVLIVPNIVGRGEEARITATKSDLRTIGNALEMYRLDNSYYPSTSQGLEALVSEPSGIPEARNWRQGGYLKKKPVDQWSNDYVYTNEGMNFEIVSYGADGQEGGEGPGADIYYTQL